MRKAKKGRDFKKKEWSVVKFLKEIATYWDEVDDSEKQGIE